MRLSTVFELLLIFLLIAFAAYGRVIEHNEVSLHRVTRAAKQNFGVTFPSLKQATENVNRFCMCENVTCSCCGNFNFPLFILRDRACVSVEYMDKNKMAVQFNIGENRLATKVISGDRPRAVCVPMPGSVTKFCGRIYSISREDSNHFKACLGVELQTGKDSEIEAAIRVSCFRFGPDGIKLRPAEPLPLIESTNNEEEDDDDDYDIFGDESDENTPEKKPQSTEEEEDDDDDDDDILGFESLIDLITGEDDSSKKKTTTPSPSVPFTIPLLIKPTPSPTVASPSKPVDQTPLETKKPTKMPELPITSPALTELSEVTTGDSIKYETTDSEDNSTTLDEGIVTEDPVSEASEDTTALPDDEEEDKPVDDEPIVEIETPEPTLASEVITTVVSPLKTPVVKKIIGIKTVAKKPSDSPNAITNYTKKPLVKPTKPDPVDSEEDDADYILASDSDEDDDDETENVEETEVEDEDESEEVEDEVLSAFVADDDDDEETKDEKISDNETSKPEDDDNDFGMNLEEFMARKQSARRQWTGRQSKVMRL